MTEISNGTEQRIDDKSFIYADGSWFQIFGEPPIATVEQCLEYKKLVSLINENPLGSIFDSANYALGRLIESSNCPIDVLSELTELNVNYKVNTSLAGAPNITMELLNKLVSNAEYRWEWRALSWAYKKKLNSNDELVNILKDNKVTIDSSPQLVLSIGTDLAETLYQELAIDELITFYFYEDPGEGDHFGPEGFDFEFTAAEYLLAPFCDPLPEWIDGEQDDDDNWELEIDPDLIRENLDRNGYSYADLGDSTKETITDALIETVTHPMLGGFKISQHLLSLILLHPSTSDSLREKIKALKEPNIRIPD